jgi:hypothetical protein
LIVINGTLSLTCVGFSPGRAKTDTYVLENDWQANRAIWPSGLNVTERSQPCLGFDQVTPIRDAIMRVRDHSPYGQRSLQECSFALAIAAKLPWQCEDLADAHQMVFRTTFQTA